MEALLYRLTLLWARLHRRPAPYRVRLAGDVPEEPQPGVLYIVGDGE